mgnify:CR=1 FL=1|tara:strand:- start:3999 stop:6419 length:2421 start_codon:yes stop_codon:yes gene_type:complete
MAIEKSLYSAPQGLDLEDSSELEIEVINPDMVTLDDGSVEITIMPESGLDDVAGAPFDANLAEYLDDGQLLEISSDLLGYVEADVTSRKDWADTFVKGLEVLGFKYDERTEPWEGACGVYSTVLAEAAIRFQAEAMSETFPASGPVKTKIIGEVTKEKEDAAMRVKADMNYELTEVMVEYRPEHERMLYTLGLAGSAFKKVYFDPNMGRQVSVFIPPEDVIVPYGASTIESAERVTHIMRKTKNELKKLQYAGFYRDVDLGEPTSYRTDVEEKKAEEGGYSLVDDDRYALCEIHVELVIEDVDGEEGESEDQIAKPYVITIERGSRSILAIRRNWNPDDPLMRKRQHFVHYAYVPGFGFYGLGLIHIIGGYAKAGTSLIRQLVDAGTLSNLPGGLKSRGLRIKGDDTPISPGEFRDVDIPSGAIRDNIMPLPYKEPSQVLLALLNQITEEGRRLGAISDMNISDMSANAPVGTTLALLERTLKPMAAVQARVHYTMKQEFKLLKAIIAEYAPEEYTYVPDRGEPRAKRADYEVVDVIPVSDPNSSTMAQRVVQYQAVLQMAQGAPQIYDLPQLHRQMIEVMGIKNADKLVPVKDDIKPADPVSENMNVLVGKPIKAFISQDHDAHLATHQAFMQDPQIAAFIGQNPAAQQIMSALMAHMAEHVAFSYRQQIENALGVPLPAPNAELPEEMEVKLASLIAEAAQQNTQQKQAAAAQQAAQQNAQDPIMQMQMQELQLKTADQQRKAQKDQADAMLDAERLKLDREKAQSTAALEASRIAAMTDQADAKQNLEEAKAILEASRMRLTE